MVPRGGVGSEKGLAASTSTHTHTQAHGLPIILVHFQEDRMMQVNSPNLCLDNAFCSWQMEKRDGAATTQMLAPTVKTHTCPSSHFADSTKSPGNRARCGRAPHCAIRITVMEAH